MQIIYYCGTLNLCGCFNGSSWSQRYVVNEGKNKMLHIENGGILLKSKEEELNYFIAELRINHASLPEKFMKVMKLDCSKKHNSNGWFNQTPIVDQTITQTPIAEQTMNQTLISEQTGNEEVQ
ncbi:hypothetical protein DVH24_023130 [Malus domestica]|uniref:Uncharacterized protein n=1 Tax=Malus domestica TaxID=3750 RepID=A0A498KN94_MALDO|nr:hypothetical protein DVH24_023130 [Malus domestica]